MPFETIWILIPAYKPDQRLNLLISELMGEGFLHVVVVDDGSGGECAAFFDAARASGATVLVHDVNRGKGAALKTGFGYISVSAPDACVITADADGQHRVSDIVKLKDAGNAHPGAILLGARDKRLMPARSRAGNTLTCFFFGATTGLWLKDTQTGLRLMPPGTLGLMAEIAGDRYEYELNVLITASRERIPVVEIAIDTVYIDNNSSSHFDALRDSARIYALLFRQFGAYAGSSLAAMGIDYGVAVLLRLFFPTNVAIPTYTARALSSVVNYLTNSRLVFKKDDENRFAVVKYYMLVVVVAILQVQLIRLFTLVLPLPYLLAKIIADGLLFIGNFSVQKALVFKKIHLKHSAHKSQDRQFPEDEL